MPERVRLAQLHQIDLAQLGKLPIHCANVRNNVQVLLLKCAGLFNPLTLCLYGFALFGHLLRLAGVIRLHQAFGLEAFEPLSSHEP